MLLNMHFKFMKPVHSHANFTKKLVILLELSCFHLTLFDGFWWKVSQIYLRVEGVLKIAFRFLRTHRFYNDKSDVEIKLARFSRFGFYFCSWCFEQRLLLRRQCLLGFLGLVCWDNFWTAHYCFPTRWFPISGWACHGIRIRWFLCRRRLIRYSRR